MLKFFLNFLFPNKCIICENYANQGKICSTCWGNLNFITKPCCKICGFPFDFDTELDGLCGACIVKPPKYNKAIAVFKYDHFSKKIIHKFKYQDQLHLLNYLTNLMINSGKDITTQADIIIPVAMHKFKLLKRGYNQAALLAMKISTAKNIKYLPQAIIKNENTIAQAGLKKDSRLKNVKNSFILNEFFKEEIKGKKILLIDDVVTTGATIDECCKILKTAKPAKIFVLTLAKRV